MSGNEHGVRMPVVYAETHLTVMPLSELQMKTICYLWHVESLKQAMLADDPGIHIKNAAII